MRFSALLSAFTLVCAPALTAGTAQAQQDFRKVELKTQKLSERVHVLFGAGGNIGLFLGDKQTLMIDDQFLPLAPRIEKAIRKLKRQDIAYLINTHYHGDHAGGNAYFGKKGALIIAHNNVRARLSTSQTSGFDGSTIPAAPVEAWPGMTYSGGSALYQDGETIQLIYAKNAHTDGDTLVYFKDDNIIHMGDTFFYGRWPYIDTQAGGSLPGVVAALDKAIALIDDETQVIPGHGEVTNRKGMIETRDALAAIAESARAFAAAGGDREGFVASNPSRAYPGINKTSGEAWSNRFLGTAFDTSVR